MTSRARKGMLALSIGAVLAAAPASAQIVQSVHVGMGLFVPRGFDSRDPADTLAADLTATEPLKFDIGRLRSGQFFGEWNLELSPHLELGVGVGYYRGQLASSYRDLVNFGGSEIRQDIHLRILPITAAMRVLPFGSRGTVQPYVGGGVTTLTWRYSESGNFVDTTDNNRVFSDEFHAAGRTTGRVLLLGLRMPFERGHSALTAEWRYQFAVGKTGGLAAGFLGETIDLGGGALHFGFLSRF